MPAVYFVRGGFVVVIWWKATGRMVREGVPIAAQARVSLDVLGEPYVFDVATWTLYRATDRIPLSVDPAQLAMQRERVEWPLDLSLRHVRPEEITGVPAERERHQRSMAAYHAKVLAALMRFMPATHTVLPGSRPARAYQVKREGHRFALELLCPTKVAIDNADAPVAPTEPLFRAVSAPFHPSNVYPALSAIVKGREYLLSRDGTSVMLADQVGLAPFYLWAAPTPVNLERAYRQRPPHAAALPGFAAWYWVERTDAGIRALVSWSAPNGTSFTDPVSLGPDGCVRWNDAVFHLVGDQLHPWGV